MAKRITVAKPPLKNPMATKICCGRWLIGKTPTREQNMAAITPQIIPIFAQALWIENPRPRRKPMNNTPERINPELNTPARVECPSQPNSEMKWLSGE